MKAIFTICTYDYLDAAFAMQYSAKKHNNDFKNIIFLIPNKIKLELNNNYGFEIIEISNQIIPEFNNLKNRYTNFELSCALKPFLAFFLLKSKKIEEIIYLDSDILVTNNFNALESIYKDKDIIITPHITTPYPIDSHFPKEDIFLVGGNYNAGFFALKKSNSSINFLDWWSNKTLQHCFVNPLKGLFVDQHWLNLAPLFFENIMISKHEGLNVAYWNLHERSISIANDTYFVNNNDLLIFYHLSGFEVSKPSVLSKYQTRYQLLNLEYVTLICSRYAELVLMFRNEIGLEKTSRKSKLNFIGVINVLLNRFGLILLKK